MVETKLSDDGSLARPPSTRGQPATAPGAGEGVTRIGKSVIIEGEVSGSEDLVIDGKVDGTIELPQHVLTIGPTGRIKAQVVARSVVVLGRANGSIRASDKVSIGKTGSVEGKVSAPRVVIADGAHLQGRVDMQPRPPNGR